jgi:hypothetical protein
VGLSRDATITMVDRSINLLVLFVLAALLAVLAEGLHGAWNTTPPWDKEWMVKPDLHPSHSSEQILIAIQNATALHEYADAKRLEQILERYYEPTGQILVHISLAELYDIALLAFAALALLVVPLSINYLIRHEPQPRPECDARA